MLLGLSFVPADAKEVEVEEVTISLYSRPANGFRMVLDRRMGFVSNQIMKHVSKNGGETPFQYEHTIIYENIRYKPLKEEKDVSLYYLIRSVEDQFTEITAVVMYDYKRSVNPREFPELSDLFLADLAVMVRRITGDDIVFEDKVFTEESVRLMASESSGQSEPDVEHFEEEEVENNSVLIRKDPFNPAENEAVAKERSEKEKLRVQNTYLQDSVRRLNREIKDLKKRFVNADEISVGNAPSELVAELRKQLEESEESKEIYLERNDSLIRISRTMQALLDEAADEEAKYKPQIEELRKENERLITENESLKGSGRHTWKTSASTEDIAKLQSDLEAELVKNKKLEARSRGLELENNDLLEENRRMDERVASLQNQLNAANQAAGLKQSTQDSLKLLAVRTEKLKEANAEIGRLKTRLDSQGTSGSKTEQELSEQQKENARLQAKNDALVSENADLKSNLEVSLRSLTELNENSKALLDKHKEYEQRLVAQQETIEETQARAATSQARADVLSDSIAGLNNRTQSLNDLLRQTNKQLNSSVSRVDSMGKLLARADTREEGLINKIAELQNTIDSMSVRSEPVDDQQRFIREQWTKLENWNRELDARNADIENREKLVARREAVLAEKEARLSNLDEREAKLNKLENEQKVKNQQEKTTVETPANAATQGDGDIEITTSNLTERGVYVPVFEVKSKLSYKGAQRQVAAYMNSRGHLFDEKFPDMLYDSVNLPEIHGSPVSLRLRIEAFGTGSVIRASVRLRDGRYVNAPGTESMAPKAEQFLREMFGFSN